jgi:c-di-GMP-binding flagellar brake protein YcgR
MFQDTRPADLDTSGLVDPYAQFRVNHPTECLALLRQLRDGSVPVILNGPDGHSMTTNLWALDDVRGRLNFSAEPNHPALPHLVDGDEAVAVAYLESVKLQFELPLLILVRSFSTCALQSAMPREIYRFQRREAYRVRVAERQAPTARFRHPSLPDMVLALRVLDVSAGGCALWQPMDVPPLQAGTRLAEVVVELDEATRFVAALTLQHVTAAAPGDAGVRLGCAWQPLSSNSERSLLQWIDHAQKRRRLVSLL